MTLGKEPVTLGKKPGKRPASKKVHNAVYPDTGVATSYSLPEEEEKETAERDARGLARSSSVSLKKSNTKER